MIVVEMHAHKLIDSLGPEASSLGFVGPEFTHRRLLFDSVYTICTDVDTDPIGCDLCQLVDGKLPDGCMPEQPNSCACTSGPFASAPAGSVPTDPQQVPRGCNPN